MAEVEGTPIEGEVAVQPTEAPAVEAPAEEKQEPPKASRTYTQEDLDRITDKVRRNASRTARIAAERDFLARQNQPTAQTKEPTAPQREGFASYEEYLQAQARHEAQAAARGEVERAQKAERERAANDAVAREWNEKIEAAKKDLPDFDQVVEDAADMPLTQAMAQALRESDRGAHLIHYLATHADEAERISKLTPARQMAAIVALEEKVAKPSRKPSSAPAPLNPVGTSESGGDVSTTDPRSDRLSTAEWMKRERVRMEKAAGAR